MDGKAMDQRAMVTLSKRMSLALRHEPERFGLVLDEQGWTPLDALVRAMQKCLPWATEEAVRQTVAASDKQRFEIRGEAIRARYGHSVAQRLRYTPVEPPEALYHGTSPAAAAAILHEGLRPMGRQYIHLSTEVEQARQVGARHTRHRESKPVVLTVRAHDAWVAGVHFYRPEARLYLADAIPPEFIAMPD